MGKVSERKCCMQGSGWGKKALLASWMVWARMGLGGWKEGPRDLKPQTRTEKGNRPTLCSLGTHVLAEKTDSSDR
jgi:hypothetical protein